MASSVSGEMARWWMRVKWKVVQNKRVAAVLAILAVASLLLLYTSHNSTDRAYNEQRLEALIRDFGNQPFEPLRPTFRERKYVRVSFDNEVTEMPAAGNNGNALLALRDGNAQNKAPSNERLRQQFDDEKHRQVERLVFKPNSTSRVNRTSNIDALIGKLLVKKERPGGGARLKGGPAQCKLYDLQPEVPIWPFDECMTLDIKPSVIVCLHPVDVDTHVSRHLRAEGIWEPHIITQFQNLLWGDPDLGVIDIGAHIGIYSLIAATMGHKVVAVEPHSENIRRLHMGAKLGNVTERIKLVTNAISEERRQSVRLKLYNDNLGGTALQWDGVVPCVEPYCPPSVSTIVMDDLLEVIDFKKAIMKIDIEGHEHRALRQASALFDEIDIPCIFMEWMKLRTYYGSEVDQSEDKTLVFQLVDDLTERGYSAYSLVTGAKLLPSQWFAWTDDIIWKRNLAALN